MAHSSVMLCAPPSDLLLQSQKGPDYLTWVSNIVSTHKGKTFKLENPAGATWSGGGLNDTIYKDDDIMVYEWENFYLKDEVSMQVLGVVEGTSLPGKQFVLMTWKDRKMYIYGEMEVHLVAPSLEHLCKKGINYPPSVTYDVTFNIIGNLEGGAFKDMTKEDWDKVRTGAVGKQLDEKHHQLVMSLKSNIMSYLPSGCQPTKRAGTQAIEEASKQRKRDNENKRTGPERPLTASLSTDANQRQL